MPYKLTNDICPKNHPNGEGEFLANGSTEQEQEDFGTITTQKVDNELENVLKHTTTLFDSNHNGVEVIIRQDNIGGLLGNIRSCNTHSNTNVGSLDSRSV